MKATVRIKTKHIHDWSFYCTFSGGGTNGSTRICDGCGARRRTGVRTKAIKHEGKTFFREEGINDYARKGEPFKPIGRAR